MLASGSDDLHVVLWNWEKGNLLAKVESGHMANVFQVSVTEGPVIEGGGWGEEGGGREKWLYETIWRRGMRLW